MDDMNEAVVAQVDDLQDGEMKQVKIGETDVLLAKVEGKYFANAGHTSTW